MLILWLVGLLVVLLVLLHHLVPERAPRGRFAFTVFGWLPGDRFVPWVNLRAVATTVWLLASKTCETLGGIFGLHFLFQFRMIAFLSYWQEHHGSVRLDLGARRQVIMLDDPASLQHMLQSNFGNYLRAVLNTSTFRPVLGDGIFNANGDSWRLQRTTARPFFKHRAIEASMAPVFERHTEVLCKALEERVGQVVDMQELFNRFTLDAIGEIAFGLSFDTLRKDVAFSGAFNRLISTLAFRQEMPLWPLMPDSRFDADLATLNAFVFSAVDSMLSKSAEELEGEQSLMSLFIKEGIRDRVFLRDIGTSFLLAGRDTTSQLLTWCLCFLHRSPAIEQRLVAELASDEKPLFRNVLDETLRLVPPVPLEGREALEDDLLPNGIFVPKGCLVGYVGPAYGRLEKLWGPDAHLFNPDRFADRSKIRPYQYLAFHGGEQRCLGQQMAYREAETVLVALLSRFSFALVEQPVAKRGLTIYCVRGMQMLVRRRSDAVDLEKRAKETPPFDLRARDCFWWR
jgi:cytochrome P450